MATPGPWTVYAFETATGQVVAELPYSGVMQYQRQINTQGAGSVILPLTGNGLSTREANQILSPWRFSLALCFNSKIVQAGPIVSESYIDQMGQSTVTISGIWAMLTKRLVFNPSWSGVGSPAVTAADTSLSSMTQYQIAKTLVQNAALRSPLPIVLPPDDVAGTSVMTYYGYDMNTVSDMLTNITQLVGGPEIEFSPEFSDNSQQSIQWRMNIGKPALGQQGLPWAYDYGQRGCCSGLDVALDGSKMTFSDYVRGSGSQYAQIIGSAQNLAYVPPYPLIEDVDGNHTSVVDAPTAVSYAQANVNTYRYPLNTWTAYVSVSGNDSSGQPTGSPSIDELTMGDSATFTVQGHRRINDGTYTHRIIGVENYNDDVCKLVLQPSTGVI